MSQPLVVHLLRSERLVAVVLLLLLAIAFSQSSCRSASVPTADQSSRSSAVSTPVEPGNASVESRPTEHTVEGVVSLPGGVVCDRNRLQVLVPGEVAIDEGFLEQVVCIRGTREHEALVVVTCKPSDVHAALLLLGLESGRPGLWTYSDTGVSRVPPQGDRIRIRVRFLDETGAVQEHPISTWMVGQPGERTFPEQAWVFGGSTIDQETGDYRADSSGSLVGLVTFGDEVLGLRSVIADSIEVDAAEWEARSFLIPPPGTPVQLVFSPWID